MRRRLALVFVALTVMLAIGFLVPLGRSVSSQARLRALAGAQSDARGVATALAAVAFVNQYDHVRAVVAAFGVARCAAVAARYGGAATTTASAGRRRRCARAARCCGERERGRA